jgi:hypothetical protein
MSVITKLGTVFHVAEAFEVGIPEVHRRRVAVGKKPSGCPVKALR